MLVINDIQKRILKFFSEIPDSDQFYLTGGTALSYFYLKHRRSNDLDFFTPVSGLISPFSQVFENHLKKLQLQYERERSFHSFSEFVIRDGGQMTLVQFAQDAPFRFKEPVIFPEYPGLRVDHFDDIASNKILALFNRAALRDFIDVYMIVHLNKLTKKELIEAAGKKDPGFDLYWMAVAFERIKAFSSDASDYLMLLDPVDFKDIQKFFDGWRKEIAEELKKD